MHKPRSRRPGRKSLRFESLEDRRLLAQLNFGIPFNLGPGVNTAEIEEGPSTTADQLSLFFWRAAGVNMPTEILEATRTSIDAPFGNAVSAGAAVNAGDFSTHMDVSPDGLSLLFSTATNGGIYQATRASRNEPFGSVTSLGDLLPGQPAHQPSLSADGLTLFFTAWDTSGMQNDIYQATRASITAPWENVVKLGAEINTPDYKDANPSISSDGLRLFFNSNRPGGFGQFDLYVAMRTSADGPWQQAVNLGVQVNTAYDDKGPSISSDGSILYFHSTRPAGAGADDLYAATVSYDNDDLTKFYVVNGATQNRTYEYDAAGAPGDSYNLASSNSAPRGAASTAAGDRVWVVDANRNVYVYNTGGGLIGSWMAGSLNPAAVVEGIAVHGNDVWIVDAKSDKIYRYAGAASRLSGSQNAAGSFNLNKSNGNPKDLVTNGTSIWVVDDSTTDKVFKYTLSGSLQGSWTITTSGATSPTGITLNPVSPSALWIVDNGTKQVYEYANAVNQANNSSKSADSSFALAPGNTNPQGIADPPVSSAAAASATESAAIDFPSLSNSAPRRNYTPSRRPTHSASMNVPTFHYLNLLARTNSGTESTIENGKRFPSQEVCAEAAVLDAALEEMDYNAWPELLAEI